MNRGQVWWAELPEPKASEPRYRRPVVIVQSDTFNKSRIDTVVVIAITSNLRLADAPGNVMLAKSRTGLDRDSVANVSQILTLDKKFLSEQIGLLDTLAVQEIDEGLALVLGL